MKPRNFPARKLKRQLIFGMKDKIGWNFDPEVQEIKNARTIRTKKYRGNK